LFALGKATDFSRGGFKPEFAVVAQFELGILHGGAGAWIDNGIGGPKAWGGMEEWLMGSGVDFGGDDGGAVNTELT